MAVQLHWNLLKKKPLLKFHSLQWFKVFSSFAEVPGIHEYFSKKSLL